MANPNAILNSDYGPIIVNIHDSMIAPVISEVGYWAHADVSMMKMLMELQLKAQSQIVFYDVGANIGTHSLAISKIFKEKVLVRAFEAQRQVFNMLCGTMAINGVTNVHCYHNAVTDKAGDDLEIALPDYNKKNNFGGLELVEAKVSDNQNVEKVTKEVVRTISIDSFNERVDFFKVDVEGMENQVIEGAKKTIETHHPICLVEVVKSGIDFIAPYFKSLGYSGFMKQIDLILIPPKSSIEISGLEKIF